MLFAVFPFEIAYDDGETETLNLNKEQFEILEDNPSDKVFSPFDTVFLNNFKISLALHLCDMILLDALCAET